MQYLRIEVQEFGHDRWISVGGRIVLVMVCHASTIRAVCVIGIVSCV
jgi:hypothetical protein